MYLLLKLILLVFVNCVESEVVDLNFASCKQFFYKGSPPSSFYFFSKTAICQRYKNSYHYATLYNPADRIPVYSAYTLDTLTCPPNQPKRRSKWFIEPQLSNMSNPNEMSTEGASVNKHKMVQAINIDYINTNYDRGHLNPNFYQCNKGRTATFTLTNSVPQDPCFNQKMWKAMEVKSKSIMQNYCNFEGAKRYFITGTTRGLESIPNAVGDTEGDRVRDYNRVNVPLFMWTAACCDSTIAEKSEDRSKGFSFGYYGRNFRDSSITPAYVANLERVLAEMFRISKPKIFVDGCFPFSENTNIIMKELGVPVKQQIIEAIRSLGKSSRSSIMPYKERLFKTLDTNLHNNKAVALKNWRFIDSDFGLFDKRCDIQGTRDLMATIDLSPILIHPDFVSSKDKLQNTYIKHSELSDLQNQIKTTSGPNDITDEYIVLSSSEHTTTLSASLSRCRQDQPCDYYGYNYKWCFIDWSTHWDYCCHKACGFEQDTKYSWCYTSDDTDWAYCSRRSSMVSVPGKQCRADHECGTHGKKYHWCYTDTNQNWEYCCQPGHVCAEHGYSYKWCYVGRNTNTTWQYCYY